MGDAMLNDREKARIAQEALDLARKFEELGEKRMPRAQRVSQMQLAIMEAIIPREVKMRICCEARDFWYKSYNDVTDSGLTSTHGSSKGHEA
jgi:hypothetical protein